MSNADSGNTESWNLRVRETLSRYAEPLLRDVANRLLRPRSQWPIEELIDRCVASLTNAAVIDRRLKDLSESSRKLLAVVALSGQPVWRVGELLNLLAVLDHVEGMTPILALLDAGLAHPLIQSSAARLKQFEDWLGAADMTAARLFIHPAVSVRMRSIDLGVPPPPSRRVEASAVSESDGFEWLLRLAAAWQRVGSGPLRLTQQGTLFKRDVLRFQNDAVLAAPFTAHGVELPDIALLALEWALAVNLLDLRDGELRPVANPVLWNQPLAACLTSLWAALFRVEAWNPGSGYQPTETDVNFASIVLSSFLLLRVLPPKEWLQAEVVVDYLWQRHPSWAASLRNRREKTIESLRAIWLGLGAPLRLIDAIEDDSGWWFRLGDVGRHLLLDQPAPNLEHRFQQTLVLQPNGELVVFRQGLTPALIGRLTEFALWKTIGSACTMELTAESVYRGLESGMTLTEIQRTLEQHGSRSIPANVLDSLQRWSNKRERITVYTAATLLEFANPADLEAAIARGLVSTRLTDRIGLAQGDEIDYRHFRLIGNRDYEARTTRCISFDPDGVTFTVDGAQSDLLLEAELTRLAEPLPDGPNGQRRYLLTPESLRSVREQGWTIAELEQWVHDRSELPLSASARLLFSGNGAAATYQNRLVVMLPSEIIADGIMQWTATAALIEERIGLQAIVVDEANLSKLIERLQQIGIEMKGATSTPS